MLILSQAQYAQFQFQAQQDFEALARSHVRRHFADVLTNLGEAGAWQLLSRALQQARQLDLLLQPDVMKYVSLVFEFGPDFPTGQGFEWARDILDDGLPDRLPRLFNAGLQRAGTQAQTPLPAWPGWTHG